MAGGIHDAASCRIGPSQPSRRLSSRSRQHLDSLVMCHPPARSAHAMPGRRSLHVRGKVRGIKECRLTTLADYHIKVGLHEPTKLLQR